MEDNQSFLDLQVDEHTGTQLVETSRWAKFLAVAVLAATGLCILLFVAVWGRLDSMFSVYEPVEPRDASAMKFVIAFVILIMVVIVVVLMTFLLRGAKAIKASIQQKDQALFNTGLAHFRNYLVTMGVLSLIGLVFMLLGFLVN